MVTLKATQYWNCNKFAMHTDDSSPQPMGLELCKVTRVCGQVGGINLAAHETIMEGTTYRGFKQKEWHQGTTNCLEAQKQLLEYEDIRGDHRHLKARIKSTRAIYDQWPCETSFRQGNRPTETFLVHFQVLLCCEIFSLSTKRQCLPLPAKKSVKSIHRAIHGPV